VLVQVGVIGSARRELDVLARQPRLLHVIAEGGGAE
jgi:hypothetical protein